MVPKNKRRHSKLCKLLQSPDPSKSKIFGVAKLNVLSCFNMYVYIFFYNMYCVEGWTGWTVGWGHEAFCPHQNSHTAAGH